MSDAIISQIEELKSAIASLEAQRAILGDAVTDTALASMRQQLAELEASLTPVSQPFQAQRKQITVLFADVSGFTSMSETMDAEEVGETMNAVWDRLDAVIIEHGGRIDKHIGDAVMALWGVDHVREDDPEQSIRAALAMQETLKAFNLEMDERSDLQMRIGINTGPVLLGAVGTMGEFTAMGDTVNLASRLEQAAPVGGILIAHNTYRHVRGVFDVQLQSLLTVKGKSGPIQSYIIQRAKPRAFNLNRRGVEGIETRIVGRDAELGQLKDIFTDTVGRQRTQLVTIVGEAGIGKSRLLSEFINWADLIPIEIWSFNGRATQQMSSAPYALIRDIFAHRFQIQDSDTGSAARYKLVTGITFFMDTDVNAEEKAHFIGQLIQLDFSDSPYLQGILADAQQIRERAFYCIAQFFRAIYTGDNSPIIIQLDDVHWADAGSLALLQYLTQHCADIPMLILCLARPTLFEQYEDWDNGQDAYRQIDLPPLSREDSDQLVSDILQKVELVPQMLREMIIARAAGNPFYIEELIKMLLEDGAIVKNTTHWHVIPEKLALINIPATLSGILQARLDSLPTSEKVTLQCASVVGRVFWDSAVAQLNRAENLLPETTQAALEALVERELIFKRNTSTFAETHEFTFKNTILHDVAYESVLKRVRRVYHANVADWIVAKSGERRREYAGLIGEHYEQASEADKAITHLIQAGKWAYEISAYREARSFFDRAVKLAEASEHTSPEALLQYASMCCDLGRICMILGDTTEAEKHLAQAKAMASKLKAHSLLVKALNDLADLARAHGEWEQAKRYSEESLQVAEETDDYTGAATALRGLGNAAQKEGDMRLALKYMAQSLAKANESGDRRLIAYVYASVGSVTSRIAGGHEEAEEYYRACLPILKDLGDKRGVARILINLGVLAYMQGNHTEARTRYQESLEIVEEIGDQDGVISSLANLSEVCIDLELYDEAKMHVYRAMSLSSRNNNTPLLVLSLVVIAKLIVRDGQYERAAELTGLAVSHPGSYADVVASAEMLYPELKRQLGEDGFEAAQRRGESLDLDAVIETLLASHG